MFDGHWVVVTLFNRIANKSLDPYDIKPGCSKI